MAKNRDADAPTAPDAAPAPLPEAATAEPAPATKPNEPERLTPTEWAVRKGIAPVADRPWHEPIARSTEACPLGIHLHAADVLHGWSHHAFHYQAPEKALRITEADFDKALEAAAAYPAKGAHMLAVAPSCPFIAEHKARAQREEAAAEAAKKQEQA